MPKKQRFIASREQRYAQTPIIIEQIKSLRNLLEYTETKELGGALSSNMIGGFALEISLKLFYMTFNESPPNDTHKLYELWENFPHEWKFNINREYIKNNRSNSKIYLFALKKSRNSPMPPQSYCLPKIISADDFFKYYSNMFFDSRYLYEKINDGEWLHVSSSPARTLAMLDTLTSFYEWLLENSPMQSQI